MPPHGNGMYGAMHSHNPEYPDDSWNLYAMLNTAETTSLNVTNRADTIGIFKPHARRLDVEPKLVSDADQEIIIVVKFISPVNVRKMIVIGGGEPGQHPSSVRCYVNIDNIDFANINDMHAAQEFNLPINQEGTVELTTSIHPFTTVNTLTLYFPANHGENDVSCIQYIGLQGEHTHYRREAVHTDYELLCSGQDTEVHTDEERAGHHLH